MDAYNILAATMNVPLLVVACLFGLSLFAAVILFKFLQSTALIENKRYRAGGAIAGFIIVYGMLHTSYAQLSGYSAQKQELNRLLQFTKEATLSGTVTPSTSDTLVLVSAWEAPTDISGAFSVKTPCMQGSDQVKLVITQQGRHFMKYVAPGESRIDVKLPSDNQ